jgi:ATP-dependent exoDNAse (exonuclease V) beta subunit
VAAPGLRRAREEEARQDYLEKERIWYVASTRARDLLIVPEFVAGDPKSWSKVIDRTPHPLPELDLSALSDELNTSVAPVENAQTSDVFVEQERHVRASSPMINWSQPSIHDPDHAVAVLDAPSEIDTVPGWIIPRGAGRVRGSVMHKLFEELLTGEMPADRDQLTARSRDLLGQLMSKQAEPANDLADPAEMATAVCNTLKMVDIEALLPFMITEVAVWERKDTEYLAGRADALVMADNHVAGVIDWKSDIAPTRDVTAKYVLQVAEYLRATGAVAGAVVFMSMKQIIWVGSRDKLFEICGVQLPPA